MTRFLRNGKNLYHLGIFEGFGEILNPLWQTFYAFAQILIVVLDISHSATPKARRERSIGTHRERE